jgi:hypothetical protein
MEPQAEMTAQLEMLKDEFLYTAEWRRQKAIEYPDDERNLEAAALLERLANTVDQLDATVLRAYVELWRDDECYERGETHREMLGGIGFQWAPETATEFVREFIEKMTQPAKGNEVTHEQA